MNATVLNRRVSLSDLQRWAELSGDHNPLHVDPDYARGTRYGQPIAHGHLTFTWIIVWAIHRHGGEFAERGLIEGLRFLAPVVTETDYVVEAAPDESGEAVEVRGPDGTVAVRAHVRFDPRGGEERT